MANFELWGRDTLEQFAAEATRKLLENESEIKRLRAAIQQTLDENGHLADGDVCKLILLKRAIEAPNVNSTAKLPYNPIALAI